MPKVSKNRVPDRVYQKLFALLPAMIYTCGSTSQADSFTNALFSSSEKTMIAKRLAIILMLSKGQSYDHISVTLKVSQGTIAKMAEAMSLADAQFLREFEKVARSDAASDFWNELGYKLETLLPPKGGDWSAWRSRMIRAKIDGEQPF